MPPKAFFVTNVLYNWIRQFKISCTNVWRRNSFWEIVTKTIRNGFVTFDPGDLYLWPSDPKINRVPLLPRMDVWTKIEEGRSRHSWVIDRKRFGHIWPQWPWPLTPRSIGFLCYQWWMCGPSLRKVGQDILELLIENVFGTFDPGDLLTQWP